MDDVVRRALEAMVDRDWEALRFLLHPYLHWTRPDGHTLRGRTKIIGMLAEREPPAEPAAYELRDGQIYRWKEERGGSATSSDPD
jgi:hypothetical protein